MRFYPPRSRGAANLIFISLTLPGILLSTILTLTDALEDVGQKRFSFSGTIRSDAKAGDEVQLNSSIASYYSKILLSSLTNKHHKVKICGYTVYRDPYMLFKVNPESTATGSAKIVLTKDIKSENFKWNYTFEIAPHTCESGRHLERSWVKVQVLQSKKWKPRTTQTSYSVDALEGDFYDQLIKIDLINEKPGHLKVNDNISGKKEVDVKNNGSASVVNNNNKVNDNNNDVISQDSLNTDGKVCSFEILTRGVPFEVDEKGVVKNTEPLDPAKQEVWQFSVVAKSCDPHDLPSDEVKVIVKVKPACQAEWIGIRERMDFSPHDGKILIAPEAELDTCDDKCNVTKATVSIKLNTEHIGKGCDRDTYSLHSQRKLCGANPEAVDLLPSPLTPDSWTRNLPTDDGKESDEVFAFDGKHDSVIVPLQIKLGREFSISTWMKHDDDDDDEDDGDSESIHRKENILCISDNEEMNRQHMSLFVRRCHLVLLLRQEPDSGLEQDGFAPAEWRWSLPEICDGSWHHYTVVVTDDNDERVVEKSKRERSSENLNATKDANKPVDDGGDDDAIGIKILQAPLPRAKLFVDGKAFIENKKNFNVVNDFPMHLTKKVHSTKIAIGGCWMGGMQHVSNHFKGYLAGLSLLNNRVESNSAIQCLTRCQEKLDFNAVEDMDSGMAVSMNSDMTSIAINGPSLKNVETLLRKISYVNTRNFPTPGHRPVTFDTELTCSNGRHLEVAPLKSLLIVSRVEKPVITLNAVLNIQEEAEEISKGVGFLKDFQIFAHSKNQADEVFYSADGKKPEFMDKYNLDSCSIHMPDPLSSQLEQIKPPLDLVKQLGLNVKVTGNGVVISGVDKLENYERVLSGTLYAHANPLNLNQRKFKVSCSELNGRYSSNVLEVVMSVIHELDSKQPEPQSSLSDKLVQPAGNVQPLVDKQGQGTRLKAVTTGQSAGSAAGVVIVCIICIGFIALLATVGISRIRNAQRHSNVSGLEDKQEMEWDNSALTITVNPMDQEGLYDDEISLVSVLTNQNNHLEDDDYDNNNVQHHRRRRLHHLRHNDDDETDVDEEDEEEEVVSDDHEDDEDGDGVMEGKMKKSELEWDDSTLSY